MEKIRFDQLDLSEEVLRAIQDMGFEFASPIQEQAIPFLLQGRDVIGQAQTGTGKTAGFLVPIIDKLYKNRGEKVLIVAPTRELALQIMDFKRNGHKTKEQLIEHARDTLVKAGWDMGEGRKAPPLTYQEFVSAWDTWINTGGAAPSK